MTIAQNGSNGSASTSQIPQAQALSTNGNGSAEVGHDEMMEAVRTMLLGVGEDPEREGLLKTPKRVAEAMRFLTSGYSQSLDQLVNGISTISWIKPMVVCL